MSGSTGGGVAKPLLPDHPPLLHRGQYGEHTVYVSKDLPRAMARSNGHWTLADFQLNKQLYKGKASTLFHATCRQSGAVVALKSYSKRRLSDLNWYQVEREIRIHSQLRHPNIIQLLAAFEDDHYVFLVTEFAAGGDLYEDLKRAGGQLKERQVAGEVLPPFLAALAHMHSLSIIHRDIKPENILLAADRTLKVADFGLSIDWGEERPVTRAGTLDYMSPEVLLCPEKCRPEENKEKFELGYSDAVDVWAVGILAYELLVGRPPFERESREETYQYIAKKEPALPAWMSEHARDFILTALAKTARRRPSMAELLHHPWIQLHSRRPSIPATTPAASDMHLPLHELGAGATPFQELHRKSLHGAQSVRDFSSLLSPAASATSPTLTSLLHPALSMAGPALAATAAAAARPTTTNSRLGSSVASRPGTPTVATLSAVAAALPPSGFAAEQGSQEASSTNQPMEGHQDVVAMAVEQASPPDTAAAPAGTLSTATSIRPDAVGLAAAAAAAAAGARPTQDASFVSAKSSASLEPTSSPGHSFTHSAAAIKLLSSSYNLQQAATNASTAGGTDQQSAFLELYKSLAVPATSDKPATAGAHTPRALPLGRKSSATRPQGSGGSSRSGEAAALPPLQQQQHQGAGPAAHAASLVRLPSLRKAISQPLLHAEEAPPLPPPAVYGGPTEPAAAAQPAQPAAGEHEALTPIPEQRSSEAEPCANGLGEPSSQQDAGHLLLAAAQPGQDKQQHAAAAAVVAADADPGIPAVRETDVQNDQDAQERAARSAQLLAQHDRMREAEQKHVEKLRARSAAAASSAASKAPKHHQQAAVAAGPAQEGAGYGAGLAKSASSLFSKLLGRKPTSAVAGPAAGASAQAMPARSASSGTAGAVAAAAASPGKTPAKYRLSPPPVHISVRAGPAFGSHPQPASPRQHPSEVHSSSGGLVQRRVPSVTAKPGSSSSSSPSPARTSSITLRSPVGAARRPVPGRVVAHGQQQRQQQQQQAAPGEAQPAAAAGLPAPGHESSSASSAAGDAAAGTSVGAEALQVEPRSNSKSVRFAALERAGPSGNLDAQDDLIPAVRSESVSFTSAVSSLPSLAGSATATSPRASRKGSLSPPVSRKGSLALQSSRGSVGPRSSLSRAGSSVASAGLYGAAKPRSSKVVSMPGDGSSKQGTPASAALDGESDAGEAVQRSPASWSHSVTAGSRSQSVSPSAAAHRKSSASAARLSMYTVMLDKSGGRHSPGPTGSPGTAGSSSRSSLHKTAPAKSAAGRS